MSKRPIPTANPVTETYVIVGSPVNGYAVTSKGEPLEGAQFAKMWDAITVRDRLRLHADKIASTRFALTEDDVVHDFVSGKNRYA